MLTRITLLFVVIAMLCGTAFTLGGRASGIQQDASGIPPEHPVMLAWSHQQELGLSPEQVEKLKGIREDMAKEFAPFREQAEQLQLRMQELQQSGKQDEDAAKKLKQQGDELGTKLQPLFECYGKAVGDLLTDVQRQKLMKISEANSHPPDDKGFVLTYIMQSRDQLEITPQQFTKLMYLQADFIRAFAPIRERMELLQIEMKQEFGDEGKQPTPAFVEIGAGLQKQVTAIQAQISDRAVKEVLDANQRTKLEGLLHGEHRSAQNGG